MSEILEKLGLERLRVGKPEYLAAARGVDGLRKKPVFERLKEVFADVFEVIDWLDPPSSPSKKPEPKKPEKHPQAVEATEPFDRAVEKATGTVLTRNETRLIINPTEAFAHLEQAIDKADKRIYINVSSFADDSTGQRLAEKIITAKKRKPHLDIAITVDQFACFLLDSHKNILKGSVLGRAFFRIIAQYPQISFEQLIDVIYNHHTVYDTHPEIQNFLKKELGKFLTRDLLLQENAVLRKLYDAGLLKIFENDLDQIDHSKAAVIDDETLVTDANIGDQYSGGYDSENGKWGKKPEEPTTWQKLKHKLFRSPLPDNNIPWHGFMVAAKGPAVDIVGENISPKDEGTETRKKPSETQGESLVRVLHNSNKEVKAEDTEGLQKEKQITWAIHHLIDNAQEEIILDHAYISDTTVIQKLEAKAREGKVKIRIMEGEAENESFAQVNHDATKHLKGMPNVTVHRTNKVIHAKTMIVDGQYAIIGSANLSFASLHQHSELAFMVSGKDNPLLKQIKLAHAAFVN